jgi:hypothetical protein
MALAIEPLHSNMVMMLDIWFTAWFSLFLSCLILAAPQPSFVAMVYWQCAAL